jgi:hypothetical protein
VSGNTVTVNPPADLAAGTAYHVEIAAGAIKDLAGNNYAGISDGPTLNFATAAAESQLVSFAAGSLAVSHNEGSIGTTDFTFVVERSGGTTGDVSFSVTLAPGTTDAADYAGGVRPTTVSGTIASGQSSGTVTIHVAGDTIAEANENFTLTLDSTVTNSNSGVNVALGPNNQTATGTIVDDDNFTHIYTIQGSGHVSALAGQAVTTRGVVTAVDTTSSGEGSRGFYLQVHRSRRRAGHHTGADRRHRRPPAADVGSRRRRPILRKPRKHAGDREGADRSRPDQQLRRDLHGRRRQQ